MGWRASTLKDLIVVVLVRHGQHTIKDLAERISRPPYFDEWLLLYGRDRWPDSYMGYKTNKNGKKVWSLHKAPPALGYTDLYQRLKWLEAAGRVTLADGRGPSNALIWRAVSREDKEAAASKLRERLRIPGELREQASAAAAKIACTVEFEVKNERGYIRMKTPRGPVVVDGPPEQSWWDAAIDLGLA